VRAMSPKRDRTNMSTREPLSSSMKTWPLRLNLNNSSSSEAPAATQRCQGDAKAEPNNGEEVNMTALWMKRLGMLFPGNANLKEEILQPPTEESPSRPARRLSLEDVQDAIRNIAAMSVGSNTSSTNIPSILKSQKYSNAIDTNLKSNEEATKDTVYMLKLLMMTNSFPGDDRVNLGLPANDRRPNTLTFKPESSSDVVAVKNPHANVEDSKEEDGGGEGQDNEQPLVSLALEANDGHPPHPQDKPRRTHSPNNVEETASTTSESLSSPVKALQTLEALAHRHTSVTNSATDSDRQPSCTTEKELSRLKAERLAKSNKDLGAAKTHEELPPQTIFESTTTMLKYKPKRKNSPPSSEKDMSGRTSGHVFESFTTMNSTGTFRDTTKRCVPTLTIRSESQNIKTRNDSWNLDSKLNEKPSSNDNTSPLNNMLKEKDFFPSTGTFRDSAKRHVRTTKFESNQDWDIKPRNVGTLPQSVMPSSETAAATPGHSGDPVNNFLKDNMFPSTGTFKDSDKRHVRHISEPSPNQEWELKHQNDRNTPLWKSFSVPGSIGFSHNTDTGSNIDRHINSSLSQHDTNEGNGSEPEQQKNIFQLYMENKAKLQRELQQEPRVKHEASIPSKAAEPSKPAAKGELLVDWGDQGTDSEEEDDEENNGMITFVKNDSSRRISDITTLDFDSDDDELLDSSFEMRRRIRSLSIPEEPLWMKHHEDDESNEKQNNDYCLAGNDEGDKDTMLRNDSERTSASTETVKTGNSGRKRSASDNVNEVTIKSVEMGKGLIRNMSAMTLLEMSDEEL